MQELIHKVKRLEIKIRRLVNATFAGEYRSAFKGSGLEFDEVRAYQVGDDVRFIDWNVSAKMNNLYVKIFREERELNLFVLVDVSKSERFNAQKWNIAIELSALFGYCTLPNNDKFGLIAFSNQIELYFKPSKGRKKLLSIINSLYQLAPKSTGTDIRVGLERFHATQKRHSIVFVISDFLDTNFEPALKALAAKHEVILIRLYHPDEILGDFSGIIPTQDLETNATSWIFNPTFFKEKQNIASEMKRSFEAIDTNLKRIAQQYNFGYENINVESDYMPVLEHLFKSRKAVKS